ncbi:methyltransferase domain-containing protein [Clostridium botulinum]|nr:methyltransferase domain-containing protein [Clostridium botulinum]NFO91418.1 methyltransferase domain-containing protein [Clostridium botulinum]
MDFTGERLVFGKKGLEQLEMEHLHRYKSIYNLVDRKVVLDIACGTGYGSALLAENAKFVYGIDISEETIQYCKENYNMPNLSYKQGSVSEIPLEDKSVDIIISYETIEHVNEEIQNEFSKEIKRVLKDDGILIISTPDKYVYTDIPKYKNEFHIKEFYKNEFEIFLKKIFKNIKLFYQGLQICDVIKEDKFEIRDQLQINENDKDNNLYSYLIAVCSNKEINDITLSSFILDKNNLLFLLNRKFDSINSMISNNDVETNQKNIIEQKENYIEEQRKELDYRRNIIEQKENYINEQRNIIEQKENYINEQRNIIEQKENYINEQKNIMKQKENYINEQRNIIEQKEIYINEQTSKIGKIENKLNGITNSKYYKCYISIKRILGRKN